MLVRLGREYVEGFQMRRILSALASLATSMVASASGFEGS